MRAFLNRSYFSVKKTQLYDLHIAKNGKMVEFAGIFTFIKVTKCLFNIQQELLKNIFIVESMLQYLMFLTWDKSTSLGQTVLNFCSV